MNFEIMVNLGNEEMEHVTTLNMIRPHIIRVSLIAGKRSLSNRVGGTELRGNHKREQESKSRLRLCHADKTCTKLYTIFEWDPIFANEHEFKNKT